MEQKKWLEPVLIAIGVLLIFGAGFYIGWKKDPEVITKIVTEYVELPPVHDSIPYPVPYAVVEPVDSLNIIMEAKMSGLLADLFPNDGKDTVYVSKEDTTAVLKDWSVERKYAETLFDNDSLGKFSFGATVRYNRLMNFDYTYTPKQKQTETVIKTSRKFLPYLGAGFDTGKNVIAQGGVFISRDAGFALQYRYDTQRKENIYGALFMYMF